MGSRWLALHRLTHNRTSGSGATRRISSADLIQTDASLLASNSRFAWTDQLVLDMFSENVNCFAD